MISSLAQCLLSYIRDRATSVAPGNEVYAPRPRPGRNSSASRPELSRVRRSDVWSGASDRELPETRGRAAHHDRLRRVEAEICKPAATREATDRIRADAENGRPRIADGADARRCVARAAAASSPPCAGTFPATSRVGNHRALRNRGLKSIAMLVLSK